EYPAEDDGDGGRQGAAGRRRQKQLGEERVGRSLSAGSATSLLLQALRAGQPTRSSAERGKGRCREGDERTRRCRGAAHGRVRPTEEVNSTRSFLRMMIVKD